MRTIFKFGYEPYNFVSFLPYTLTKLVYILKDNYNILIKNIYLIYEIL